MSDYYNGPIWHWFNLTYSSYLVLPRTLLCGMPLEWQERMVALLDKMHEVYNTDEIQDRYQVTLKTRRGRYTADPLCDYRHPPPLPYRADASAKDRLRAEGGE